MKKLLSVVTVITVIMMVLTACNGSETVERRDCGGYTQTLGQTAPIYYDDGAKTETIGQVKWDPSAELLTVTDKDGQVNQQPLRANEIALVGQRAKEKVVVAVEVCTTDYLLYVKARQMNEKSWQQLVAEYEKLGTVAPTP